MFAALDLAAGEMFYRFRDRKWRREFLDFASSCAPLPRRLYLVCDNYAHQKAEVTNPPA